MGSGDLLLDLQVVEGGGAEVYEVKSGDSLSKIASHYDGVSWKEIFEANRDQLDDPDKIFPGQKLRIPKG
ncbi:MAG: LysM peptidoglycan-binding domain-containing protein [Blastocatellia bacterium]|nr:LysM peptidoglycan-binding domain-containing protein [Blastocatellia bacterium]MBK6428320.1 LysM peptidoglycan-binding domain-containing protein [Blastocatellia bacterium]